MTILHSRWRPARDRMIVSTALLVRERGARATSLDDVLEHSGAPRGSVYHHFPAAASSFCARRPHYAGAYVAERLERSASDPLDAIDSLFETYREPAPGDRLPGRLPGGGGRGRAPRTGRTCARTPSPRPSSCWSDILARGFGGRRRSTRRRADELALVIVSGFEGALILAPVPYARPRRRWKPCDREIRDRVESRRSRRHEADWQPTACILCECNCGIEVQLEGRTLQRIRGDKAHPGSQGYTCNKAMRLDHYQNGPHRLTSPMRRRAGRQLRGGRLGHGDRRDRRPASPASATSTAASRSSTTAAAARATTSAAPTAAPSCGALGSTLPLERAGPGEDGRGVGRRAALRRPHPRRVRARRGRGVRRQEPVDVAELPARAAWCCRRSPRTRSGR